MPAAERYSYTLVRVDNPSGIDPTTADSGFTVVRQDVALPSDAELGHDSNTFYLTGLAPALYVVRVRAHNPNYPDGMPSEWSDVIGTGAPPAAGGRGVRRLRGLCCVRCGVTAGAAGQGAARC